MNLNKNLLFLTTDFPYPPNDGSKIRTFYFLKYLSKHYSIDLISFKNYEKEEYRDAVYSLGINTHLIEKPKQTIITVLKALLHFMPVFFFRSRTAVYKNEINKLLSEKKYDVVHIDGIELAEYYKLFAKNNVVLDMRDAWSLLYKRKFENALKISKLIAYIKLFLVRRMEKYLLSFPVTHLLLSYSDKNELSKKNKNAAKIQLIANGVELPGENLTNTFHKSDSFIVFTGAMDYPPNEEAVLYFNKMIFPAIKEKLSNVKFYVVGKNPSKRIFTIESEETIITGEVKDINEYINKAVLVVCPLLTGTGIKNKVLEAMALRKAVVSTGIGVEGIDGTNGVHYIVNDRPEDFANSVCKLYKDPDLCKRMGDSAYQFVKNNFSWEKCINDLLNVYRLEYEDS